MPHSKPPIAARPSATTADAACHVFLHLPKTAGTTFHFILSREYRGQPSIWVQSDLDLTKTLDRREKDGQEPPRLIRGHFHFGREPRIPPDAVCFTMLRDPVDRVISYYHHVLAQADVHKGNNAWLLRMARERPSLEKFVTEIHDIEADNGMVRRLSGVQARWGELTEGALEKAIGNLDRHFLFAGLAARFDESILILRHLLRWRTIPVYTNQKQRRGPGGGVPIPGPLREMIAARNHLDIRLHQEVSRRFEERLRSMGPGFPAAVRRFQLLNRAINPGLRLALGVRSALRRRG